MVSSNSKWAKVLYRYEGEPWEVYHSTDITVTTDTEYVQVPCPDDKYFVFGTYRCLNTNPNGFNILCGDTGYWRSLYSLELPYGLPYVNSQVGVWCVNDRYGDFKIVRPIKHSQYLARIQAPLYSFGLKNWRKCENRPETLGDNPIPLEVVRDDSVPLCEECLFSIKKQGVTTFSRQREECPIEIDIIYEKETCPPNTCECLRSNGLTCCYSHRTGLVVKSFTR